MTPQIWFSKMLKHTLSPSTLRTCLLISQYFQPPTEFWARTSIPSTSLKHKIYLKALFNESIQNENIINSIWFTLLTSFQVAQLVDLFVCISFKFRAVWGSSTIKFSVLFLWFSLQMWGFQALLGSVELQRIYHNTEVKYGYESDSLHVTEADE